MHDLPFDLARKAVSKFQTTLANTINEDHDYWLCMISSSESENKSESVFATAFNRYKKKLAINQSTQNDLKEYLTKHFEVDSSVRISGESLNARIITSERASSGKSLLVKRIHEKNEETNKKQIEYYCISIKDKTLPFENIFKQLMNFDSKSENQYPRIFHFDIAFEVWYDVESFLFKLLIMSVLQSFKGEIWRRQLTDLYLIEIMSPKVVTNAKSKPLHGILTILPELRCLSPQETLDYISRDGCKHEM